MSDPIGVSIPHAVAKARLRDGTKLFVATRYDDGTVGILGFALRPGFDGSQDFHWTKPEDDDGNVIAHASHALWKDWRLEAAPPPEGEEDELVPLCGFMRPEAIEALTRGLYGRARSTWNGTL